MQIRVCARNNKTKCKRKRLSIFIFIRKVCSGIIILRDGGSIVNLISQSRNKIEVI